MTGVRSIDSLQAARYLLAASKSKETAGGPGLHFLPVFTALANLFFCVLFENPIKGDPGGSSLSLFLFIQGCAIFFQVLFHLVSTDEELLRKTLVMPVAPAGRLTYAFLSSLRSRMFLAIVSTDILFLLVLYHQSILALITIPILVAIMAAEMVLLASVLCTVAIRSSRPVTIVAAYSILGVLCLAALSLLLHTPAVFGAVPPMSWTREAILAAGSGKFGWVFVYSGATIALLWATRILGRRYA